jgi:hypothetical protein
MSVESETRLVDPVSEAISRLASTGVRDADGKITGCRALAR